MSKIEQNVETQKVALHGVVEYLEHLSNNVGKTITEYDWRECVGLIYALEQTFQKTHDIKGMREEIQNRMISKASTSEIKFDL